MAASRFRTPTRRLVLAALAAFGVFAGVYCFAASAGINTADFGANAKMAGSCGSGMTFKYATAFDGGIPGYAVDGIDLSRIPAGCLSKTVSVTFYDGGTNPSGSPVTVSLPDSGTTQRISINPSSNTIDASRISGVSVVVS